MWNTNSVLTQKIQIEELLTEIQPDIVTLQETRNSVSKAVNSI